MHASKQTEPKPRLAKDEVELLEREFAKNPKPNSSTKRELAEQMGVEVPRINNWFQNRRAKEKQMRKTAEFEAQQARERAASESKTPEDRDQGAVSEFYGLTNRHQPLGLSTAAFQDEEDQSNDDASDHLKGGFNPMANARDIPIVGLGNDSPVSPEADSIGHTEQPTTIHQHTGDMSALATPSAVSNPFGPMPIQSEFHQPSSYSFELTEPPAIDGLPGHDFNGIIRDSSAYGSFPERDYFASTANPSFRPQINARAMDNNMLESSSHQSPVESVAKSESLSPSSMGHSPIAASDMRFKSPPPPADIAGRRNLRRPAPLGLNSLRTGSLGQGPKTGIEAPRRSETASPMRRIASATGNLPGRVQKPFMSSNGPRSPFAIERNKEALLQSLHGAQSPMNGAMSPLSPGHMTLQSLREATVTTNASDEDQGYIFGSLGAVSGVLPAYKAEPNVKTPPGTPGLQMNFTEPYYAGSTENAWSYGPQDEPLPTPSLCSHGGSELEFSMAPQMPGYVASQPVTPSFPPSIGPTYNGFFGSSVASAEYNFPDSYPTESSARSSPAEPPRSKQFQFAQNVTPQDFTAEK